MKSNAMRSSASTSVWTMMTTKTATTNATTVIIIVGIMMMMMINIPVVEAKTKTSPSTVLLKHRQKMLETDLETMEYDMFPRRTEEEAAVLEWGHSAIISALDASVAMFGPQTSQAALLEVECMPILASPINGVPTDWKPSIKSKSPTDDANEENEDEEDVVLEEEPPIQKLDNSDAVHGNIVVMTNNGGLTGVGMAKVAKLSGAAALLVVNIDEERPDDIYRLEVMDGEEEDAESIDIPVVMVSLNSANVLTTATVEPGMEQEDIVNHGMPERVRLYAGGDRPFFEDVEPIKPTLYLIHNLLTASEADELRSAAETKVEPIERGVPDHLQMLSDPDSYPNVDTVMLWQGLLHTPPQKAVEDRIEQVTGFPAAHFSDWIVDKIQPGSNGQWLAHYDNTHPYLTPMATITVFLTSNGGPIVYPSSRFPVLVEPVKGLAVMHHNTDENNVFEKAAIHALLPTNVGDEPAYIARKYIFTDPISKARRTVLPALAWPFGGKLPKVVSQLHDVICDQFGYDDGPAYFDKMCIAIPSIILIVLAQIIVSWVQKRLAASTPDEEVRQVESTPSSTKKKATKDTKKSTPGKGKKGKKE